jgi:hypothetical protein
MKSHFSWIISTEISWENRVVEGETGVQLQTNVAESSAFLILGSGKGKNQDLG